MVANITIANRPRKSRSRVAVRRQYFIIENIGARVLIELVGCCNYLVRMTPPSIPESINLWRSHYNL
jgi:hypothetical protein